MRYPTEPKHGTGGYRVRTFKERLGPPSTNLIDRTRASSRYDSPPRWWVDSMVDPGPYGDEAIYQTRTEAIAGWRELPQWERRDAFEYGYYGASEAAFAAWEVCGPWTPTNKCFERSYKEFVKQGVSGRLLDRPQPETLPAQDDALREWLRQLNRRQRLGRAARMSKFGRFNPWVIGFGAGWWIGTQIWGDPSSGGAITGYTVPAGWTQITTPCDGSDVVWRWKGEPPQNGGEDFGIYGGAPLACAANEAKYDFDRVAANEGGADGSFPGWALVKWVKRGDLQPGTNTWFSRVGERITHPEGDPELMPQPELAPGVGVPLPVRFVETEFPQDMPIGQPVSVPAPQAWPDALPLPGEQPGTRPDVKPSTAPVVEPLPAFVPGMPSIVVVPETIVRPGHPGPVPVVPPIQVLEGGQGGGVRWRSRENAEPRQRPPRRKHEKKVTAKMRIPIGYVAVNLATEGFDFVDSLYNGIPKRFKNRKDTFCHAHDYKCKFAKIWQHRDEINYAEALENYINNQAEDMAFGLLGGQVAKAQHQINPGGTGLNRATQTGQAGEAETEFEGQDQTSPLPTLTYDPVTQEWGIAWEIFGLDSPDVQFDTGSPADPYWER